MAQNKVFSYFIIDKKKNCWNAPSFVLCFPQQNKTLSSNLCFSFDHIIYSSQIYTKMSYSRPINFSHLNSDIFEHILKYIKFDDLVRFERINGSWKEAIRILLNRRKT